MRAREAARTGYRAILLTLLLVLSACTYELIRHGALNEVKAAQVEAAIQRLRGLRFMRKVPIVVESSATARNDLRMQLQRGYSDERFVVEGRMGALIGLYPAGIDLKAATLDMLESQVAGFYDPDRKQMVLVAGSTNLGIWNNAAEFLAQRDVAGEMLLGHELTHALQDQHFGLQAALDRLKDDDDRALALKSVAEGDATIAGFGYVSGIVNDGVVNLVVSSLSGISGQFAAQTRGSPQGLSDPLIFQYSAGVKFVAEAFHRGGWAAVNDLYRNPPQSSQQLLDPRLYFDHPTPPVQVVIRGYERILDNWQEVDENSIGELSLRIILNRSSGSEAAPQELADRWAGDRIVALRRGSALTVLWFLAFRDDRSAQRFAIAYIGILDRLLGATPHRLDYRGSTVFVAIGAASTDFSRLSAAVWNATKLDSQSPSTKSRPARALPLRATCSHSPPDRAFVRSTLARAARMAKPAALRR